ncbi:MAG TPA: GntR family transcriptional regulator [Longimicrobium sp.]|nr:GntR family transcriptional regulator [Longimicrobium sp.]
MTPTSARRTTPDDLASSAQAAYERLRALIVRGGLAPGARVTEVAVAEQLAISRTPAREALRRLEREGLLVVSPGGRGRQMRLSVAPVSRESVLELYRAAGALEGVAGREVAGLPPEERAALAAELRRVEAVFHEAAARTPRDFDQMFESHDAFHRTLMAACAGPSTSALLESIRAQLDRYEWLYAPLVGPDISPTFSEHEAIIRGVEAGDADGIEAAVRANWFNGAERLAEVIENAGEWVLRRGLAANHEAWSGTQAR